MNIAAFARYKEVTRGAVQDAIKRGRLAAAVVMIGDEKKINVEVADKLWEIRRRPPSPGKRITEAQTDHLSARVKKDEYAAKLAQLEYEQKAAKLVRIEDVKVEAFTLARMVRDNILNIPDRISHELAAETDPHKIHILLTKSLNEALDQLASIDRPDHTRSGINEGEDGEIIPDRVSE